MNALFEVPAPPVLIPLTAVLMFAAWLILKRRGAMTAQRLLTAWVLAWYLVAVTALTMLPLQVALGDYANQVPWYEKANLVPVSTIDVATFALNIVLTLPLGLLLPLATRIRGVAHLALLAFGFSTAIEIVQYLSNVLLSSGRTGDVNDLIANTIGALFGYIAYRALSRSPRIARFVDPFRLTGQEAVEPAEPGR